MNWTQWIALLVGFVLVAGLISIPIRFFIREEGLKAVIKFTLIMIFVIIAFYGGGFLLYYGFTGRLS